MTGYEDRAAAWIRWPGRSGTTRTGRTETPSSSCCRPRLRPRSRSAKARGVARDRRTRGYEVTGLDVSPTLVEAARDADPGSRYVVGDAARLPFEDGWFDPVVSYNSLIDLDDMAGAVAEAGRVMWPGGWLCACVPHPLSDLGEFAGRDAEAPFVVFGCYLAESTYEILGDRNGIESGSRVAAIRSSRTLARSRPPGSRSRRSASRRFPGPVRTGGRASRCS